jgi:transcriptional regulator with GAF, ATPase, and Fis domain
MDLLPVEKPLEVSPAPGESLQEMELNHILSVLEDTYWRIEGKDGAAVRLGLHPDTLRSRMKKHSIRRPSANK